MKRVKLFVLLSMLAACVFGCANQPSSSEQIGVAESALTNKEAAVQAAFTAFDDAWNTGDAAAAAATLTANATNLNPFGEAQSGRDDIEAFLEVAFASPPVAGSTHTTTLFQFRFIDDDRAFVDGVTTVTGQTIPTPGGPVALPDFVGQTSATVKRTNSGAWKIQDSRTYAFISFGP